MKRAWCCCPLAVALACAGRAPPPKATSDGAVAEVYGERVTASELDASIAEELKRLDQELTQKRYEARRQGLDALIFRRLVEHAAALGKIDGETYLKREIEDKLRRPDEGELNTFYNENADRMGNRSFAEVRDRLLEFLVNQRRSEAVMALYERLKSEGRPKILLMPPPAVRVQVSATGPARGEQGARVVIVSFSDFQCPFCGRVRRVLEQVLAAYPQRVRLVFRHFPLPFHEQAFKAAEAAACADDQGAFWKMHDFMFEHQDELEATKLKRSARSLGLDGTKFDACLEGGVHKGLVERDIADGKTAGVVGTPHFFINGVALTGAQSFAEFKQLIDAEP